MVSIAAEKRKYHKRLINELLRKQKDKHGGLLIGDPMYSESPKIQNNPKSTTEIDIKRYKSLKRRKTFKAGKNSGDPEHNPKES